MKEFSLFAQSFKYWEIFLSWLFKYRSRCYLLSKEGKPVVYENDSLALKQFAQTYRHQGEKGLICQVTPKMEDIETVKGVLCSAYETVDLPQLCEWAVCEILAKALAYRSLEVGHTATFPIMMQNGKMEMATYTVDRVLDLWSHVLAFGLVRSDGGSGAPILLFRGTDFSLMSEGGRASIISDLDPKGPGHRLFEKGRHTLQEWLKKEKGRVIGHSLGGVVAAYTAITEPECLSQEKHEISYAFNFPGVPLELAQRWETLKNKPCFEGFVCRGDLISKLGNLFGKVYELSLAAPLSPVRAHETLFFSQDRVYLNEVDLERENRARSRAFYSKLQKQTSSVLYEFGLKFLFPD